MFQISLLNLHEFINRLIVKQDTPVEVGAGQKVPALIIFTSFQYLSLSFSPFHAVISRSSTLSMLFDTLLT